MRKSLIVVGATVFAVVAAPGLALANTGSGKVTTSKPDNANIATPMSDAKMAQDVRNSLAGDGSLSSQAKNLRVNSTNGAVTVSGSVASEMEKAKVESIARQMAGEKVIMDVAVE